MWFLLSAAGPLASLSVWKSPALWSREHSAAYLQQNVQGNSPGISADRGCPRSVPGAGAVHSTRVPAWTASHRELGVSTLPPGACSSQVGGSLEHRLALSWTAFYSVPGRESRCIFLEALRRLGSQDFGTFMLITTTAAIVANSYRVLTSGQAL